MTHSTLYKKRRNAIVARVKKASSDRRIILGEDRVIGSENLNPDLVFQRCKEIIIIDVTVPFDNGLDTFDTSRKGKMDTYIKLAAKLSVNGNSAVVEAVVVVALVSRDPVNDIVVKRICSRKYAHTMKSIFFSRNVFAEHTGRIPHDSDGRQI